MAKQDIDYLKGKFSQGRVPTGTDFADLIDSTVTSANSGELEDVRAYLLYKYFS